MQDAEKLNDAISLTLSLKCLVLKFVPLRLFNMFLTVFVDFNFGFNQDSSFQLWYLVTLMISSGNSDIFNYNYTKFHRTAQSLSVAELFSLVTWFDQASKIRPADNKICHCNQHLKLYTDLEILYSYIVGVKSTTEKRLLIDSRLLHQAYKTQEDFKSLVNL